LVNGASQPLAEGGPKEMANPKGGINAATAGIVKLALKLGYFQHVIASYFTDNQGRVSEIKSGKRYHDVPAADRLPPDFPAMA
jgi:hypothetical protein